MRFVTLAVLLGLTAWFLRGPEASLPALVPSTPVGADQLRRGAQRVPMSAPPSAVIQGTELRCSECHALFDSKPVTESDLLQHGDLRFDHGMNARCFNCHSYEDRNKLILHDGSEVEFDAVEQLCAKCHGPTYRDWQVGMHGKTMGSWDSQSPDFHRLGCTECHDPHAPAFDAIAPLPGPNTLRMGEPSTHSGPARKRNPLRIWSQPDQHGSDDDTHESGQDPHGDH